MWTVAQYTKKNKAYLCYIHDINEISQFRPCFYVCVNFEPHFIIHM